MPGLPLGRELACNLRSLRAVKIFNDRRGKKKKLGDIGAASSVIDVSVIYDQQDARERRWKLSKQVAAS